MGCRSAALDAAYVHFGTIKIDLVPAQVNQLRDPQAVARGDQDQGCVAMAVAIGPGSLDQALDLVPGEVFPGPDLQRFWGEAGAALAWKPHHPVRHSAIFDGWATAARCRFPIDFRPFLGSQC